MNLVRGLLVLPEGFAGFSIDGDQFAGEVSGVDTVFDEDRRACKANVIVVTPDFYLGIKNQLLFGILGRDFQAYKASF